MTFPCRLLGLHGRWFVMKHSASPSIICLTRGHPGYPTDLLAYFFLLDLIEEIGLRLYPYFSMA